MVILTENTPAINVGRLTVQTVEIAPKTTAIRCLDWDRERFDVEFVLRNGTTYNSFLIAGEKTALVDTSHRKFEELYLEIVAGLIDRNKIDYLIISHTEPDHSGLVKDILQLAPEITVVGSKVAIQFLENMVHQPFKSLVVKSGERLELGNGHNLEFISAPNLHWPDTILTYDHKTGILYTCDVFGMHYCDDHTYDENFSTIEDDFKYYYDCLMGPNARSVLAALKRIANLEIKTVATGHGPLLQYHIPQWLNKYLTWSLEQAKTEILVALFYAEDYGYSEHLAYSLGNGCTKTGVAVEFIDINSAEPQEVRELVSQASGIVIAMPSQYSVTAQAALNTILAAVHQKQTIGLLESGGGEDEPVYPLRNKFQELGLVEAFPPILIKETPAESTEKLCEEAGTDMGQWLTRDRTIKKTKSINTDLEKALGRISTGLYIITTKKGEIQSAMLASWVIQASLNPLGVAISVSKERAIESLMRRGDRFVLNVLGEDNYQGLMKHFLKRFAPGADRFEGVKTYPATNNSPILADSLAYMECEITSRMDCGDHWVIYSTVKIGRVADVNALTTVHHRKIGNHY
ncbi:diflavin flavoprotein [Nodularia sphaerocarpa]|uniref:diflavin flavoprotein n=1 Tax=Nodularia sphaerocarpa TaxID=137816 RepID=UPI001EFBAF0B|nr:diflavin flavoprotein [Nodularia sphaerocarpa]MDB9373864.1 diflavin flavoprotein [Nodularia sphaerocarpa CS-585]MDB9376603.1 diflavin flavoprotein [Nodularia sphaerocarpa CS-585A2]ULP72827.1 Putative diflavin flavoprotein A 3 [Nodularia sphaerocarpa UHCC 0038]